MPLCDVSVLSLLGAQCSSCVIVVVMESLLPLFMPKCSFYVLFSLSLSACSNSAGGFARRTF